MKQVYVNRFWQKVDKTSTCWLWKAGKSDRGYGIYYAGKMRRAHIVAYELMIGSVPEGLELDHICRIRHCVNPDHLEAVTHQQNCKRDFTDRNTHCKRGHEMTPENTYNYGQRLCKTCHSMRVSAYRKRLRV